MRRSGTQQPANIYGRRWGRGVRPYLLMVKLVCVSAFLGGLMMVLALGVWYRRSGSPDGGPGFVWMTATAYRFVIVPGATGAVTMGVLLLASIWRVLIRMRWFVAKACLVIVGMPTLHLVMSSRVDQLERAVRGGTEPAVRVALEGRILLGTAAALVLGLVIAWLGRIKPRLGQDFGRTFAGKTTH